MHKKWIKPKNNLAIEIQNLNKTSEKSGKRFSIKTTCEKPHFFTNKEINSIIK